MMKYNTVQSTNFTQVDPLQSESYDTDALDTEQLKAVCLAAFEMNLILAEVACVKQILGVHPYWTSDHPEYAATLVYIKEWKYRKGLITSCIFELNSS